MINRVNGPQIINDFQINLPDFTSLVLDNGLKVFEINSDAQPIVKLDFLIRCGRIHEKTKASARATLSMMKEATMGFDAIELAELFDYYGAEYYSSLNLDDSRITLVSLDKHLDHLLDAWSEIVFKPRFDVNDFERYQSISAQKLEHQLSKNEIIAYRQFTEKLFGSQHPYGYNTEASDIRNLVLDDITSFYQKAISNAEGALFISGNIDSKRRQKLLEIFSAKHIDKKNEIIFDTQERREKKRYQYNEGQSLQTSIKLGGKLFPRKHKDFTGMYVLNTILGGFFGSRLMTNLREEKGWCYNIYSGIDCLNHDGCWYIAADVGNEFVDKAIEEINGEIKKLKNHLVEPSELKMVKNYLLGYILSLLDGPFASSKILQGAWKNDLPMDYILEFCNEIRKTDAESIKYLANKYFDEEQIIEVQVGKYLGKS